MKVGQSLLVKRQLGMEKQLKEKMIHSVMPPKVCVGDITHYYALILKNLNGYEHLYQTLIFKFSISSCCNSLIFLTLSTLSNRKVLTYKNNRIL